MDPCVKLSAPATREFWELAVLFEDAHLLALNKPPNLLTSPDRCDPARPNLMKLLQTAIAEGKAWARTRGLSYLSPAHRPDFETSGIILLAKSKPVLVALANLFGSQKPVQIYVALVHGNSTEKNFEVDAPLAPDPIKAGLTRVDVKGGKNSQTRFEVRESFQGYTLLECRPLTSRTHQIRAHLRHAGFPIVGDAVYGGRELRLSALKTDYRLKPNKTERPLISSTALHAEKLSLPHPVTGALIEITAPWPKDLTVALKYLRRYAAT